MYVSPSGARIRAVPAARPPVDESIRDRVNGVATRWSRRKGFACPPAKPQQTMSVLARPRPAPSSRAAAQERRRRWPSEAPAAPHCRRTPLVGERVYLLRRGRRRSARSASCAGRCGAGAAERARAGALGARRRGPSACAGPDALPAPRRVGFRPPWIPSRSRSPSTVRARRSSTTSPTSPTTRVHRPLPEGLAPHAGRLLRDRGAGARYRSTGAATASAGAT